MKNKIKRFSKGEFKLERPDIRFSETQIFMSVSEGGVYEGSFTIENTKDGNVRGLIYPSSFRVHCLEEGFEGNPVTIHYTYDSTGLMPGHIESGKLTVVCNGGEYSLDFTAVVEKPYIMTAYGKVQSVADFKQLASQDFLEAQRLFRTRQFYDVLKYEDRRVQSLYANMRKWALDEQALEEFLVGIKQKEKIFLTLSEEKMEYENLLESQKGSIDIVKNTWGYAPIKISVFGDFLEVEDKELTTDDFVGNSYSLEYVILHDKLHAGNNYGRIHVSTTYETLTVDINVHQRGARDDMRGMSGMIAGQGLKDYLAFIAGKISMDEWAEKAIKRVEHLRELEPDNEYYMLLLAHVYLHAKRDEEAKWVLENNNYPKFMIGRKPEISAYYMFLTALLKKDTLHTNRVLEEINRVFLKHPYSWPLLCMVINLDTRFRDYNNRIRVLERQFFNGANSILMYAEAYVCFQENVPLLRKLDSFEVQILNFATKYKIITRDLALHMADLVCQQKKYDVKLLRILERAYEMYEEPRILQAICMQLIKGNKAGTEYFKWYEQAAMQEMKIAQLYEYYMMSVNPKRVKSAFPKIVYLYFLHGMNLDYKRIALLYENILTYENEDSDIYARYQDQMKAFAREQLLKRHINDSLRVIYNRFIQPNDIAPDEMSALYDICHAYVVTTKIPGMQYVVVIEKDGTVRQRVPYKGDRGTVVYLYDKEARIVWEGDNGCHYTDSIPYETRRLFYEMRYLELYKNRSGEYDERTDKGQRPVLSFETLKQYGMEKFDGQEVFLLCSKRIREQEQIEDDFLLYIAFSLLKEGYYDKALLSYLAQFYCGSTKDMKMVWRKAKEYGVHTKALAERIITQMLYSEDMFGEEAVFEDYYTGNPYFRLKQAYLAYVAQKYVVKNRILSENLIRIMVQELLQKEYLADICKVAILKYYAGKEAEEVIKRMLKKFFDEMCHKHLVFPFYLEYPQAWLKEVQLNDKILVQYATALDGKVRVCYRVQKEGVASEEYHAEALLPMYDGVYVKEFVLYEGEYLQYYFEEYADDEEIVSEKETCKKTNIVYEDGMYGRLSLISRLSREKQYESMLQTTRDKPVPMPIMVIV